MKRSCSSVPQRTSGRRVRRRCQKRAISARSSSMLHQAHARVRRHLEGAELDQARGGRSPSSGEYSLSMQNSARCVLPVTSISRLRNRRSTSHGCGASRRAASAGRRSPARRGCRRAPRRRAAPGWSGRRTARRTGTTGSDGSASRSTRLRSRSGRRSIGLSAGVAPPMVTWLPPPVPVWRPSSMNFSVPSRRLRALPRRACR